MVWLFSVSILDFVSTISMIHFGILKPYRASEHEFPAFIVSKMMDNLFHYKFMLP